MYNLYIYEKQILQDEKEKNDLIKKKKLKKKRKKELIKLSKNYENRMNDFILTMCQSPIFLYKEKNPYNKNKLFIKKNYFDFGSFKTDKERLESLQHEKEILKIYDKKREKDEKNRNILKIKNHRNMTIIQPKMRFNSRTKLENIIEIIKQKEKNANIDIYNNTLMEQMKKLKYNDVKKIKEYNTLIDKEVLDKKDLKEVIRVLNEKEHCEINNEYTLKNYFDWKYLGIISNNQNKLRKAKSQKDIRKLEDMLEIIGNKNKIDETNNEFECLVKDDFKTHFKGASQYIELKDLKENKDKDKAGNNELVEIANNLAEPKKDFYKKRAMSALKLTTNKSIENFLGDKNENKNKNNNKNDNEQFTKIGIKPRMKRRPASVITNKFNDNEYNYFKNEYSIKDLGEEFKMKKIMMKNMMNKEINNSIIKQYSHKYAFLTGISKTGLINPKTFSLQNNAKKESKEELKKKLTYLQEEIAREKRLRNKDRYHQFVRRFARSTYGFRKKEILDTLSDFKDDKKSEYIVVDGKVFQKNDIKNITDLVFTKCNYYNTKSDSNNGILIKNNGKLMFTSGLTVNDFSAKYNL